MGLSSPSDDAIRFTNSEQFEIYFTGTSSGQIVSTQVFRDPSAWYHLIVAVDTTQATASNRVKMYVNGVQITSFATSSYPVQNYDSSFNTANLTTIGQVASAQYFDGYLTEINLIDGQQLTPSSFGKTNAATGQWIPKKFAGTYGTNGFYLKFADASAATAAAIGKDSSPNGNNWTPNNIDLSSPTTIRSYTTTGTSTWIAPLGVTSINYLVVAGGGAGGSAGPTMYDSGSGGGGAGGVANGSLTIIPGTSYTLTVGTAGSGSSGRTRGANGSNSVFATITAIGGGGGSPGAAGNDGAAGGSGGGSSVSGAGGAGTPGQGFAGGSSTTSSGAGGGGAGGAGSASPNNQGGNGGAGFTSSISGSPVTYGGGGGGGAYSGSPGPGGSGGSSIGGAGGTNNSNGSNATGYGSGGGGSGGTYNTTGTLSGGSGSQGIVILSYTSPTSNTYDSMTDVPTLTSATAANYATLNPLLYSSAYGYRTLSNGNLTTVGNSATNNGTDYSTIAFSTGKFYAEFTATGSSGSYPNLGIIDVTQVTNGTTAVGYAANSCSYFASGNKLINNVTTAYGSSYTTGDVIGVAVDATTGTITFYKNNTSQGVAFTWTGGSITFYFGTSVYQSGTGFNCNFGQRPFTYTPPSGFVALNTYNL
jgi:hypothetical protein